MTSISNAWLRRKGARCLVGVEWIALGLTAKRDRLEIADDMGKDMEVGIGSSQRDPDVSNGDANLGTDLEQLQTDRLALRPGQISILQAKTPQRMHKHV